MEAILYRPNAGIIIFNKEGQLLWCKRKTGDGWQFPQGGIDEGETPKNAIYRDCLLYTSPSPRDVRSSRMPSSA